MEGWENFFVAQVGASAALSGLIFVAVSISLQKIITSEHLRLRGFESLLTFFGVLAISTCGLIPHQSAGALGGEIAGFSALVWAVTSTMHLRAKRDPNLDASARRWIWLRIIAGQSSSVPFIAAGVLLLSGQAWGAYLLPAGVLFSFAAGGFNAWILLVEIQR